MQLSLSTLDYASAESFLKMAAREINNNNVYLVPFKYIKGRRVRTVQLLNKIGLKSPNDIWNYILTLTKEDCIDISFDHDISRDYNTKMYEFKKEINNKKVYIKLTIRNKLVCMSFHTDHYR